jgi:twitching motility protein PilI
MSLAQETPFQWLVELEQAARTHAKGLPRQEVVQQTWRGIAFRLGNAPAVAALTDIREVLPSPKILAKVPGAKPWVSGIANIRGQLLPIIDLKACLTGENTIPEKKTRLLILNQSGVSAGILVDEVVGIKNFPQDSLETNPPYADQVQWLVPFARGIFQEAENESWIIFDMSVLGKSRPFLEAAV